MKSNVAAVIVTPDKQMSVTKEDSAVAAVERAIKATFEAKAPKSAVPVTAKRVDARTQGSTSTQYLAYKETVVVKGGRQVTTKTVKKSAPPARKAATKRARAAAADDDASSDDDASAEWRPKRRTKKRRAAPQPVTEKITVTKTTVNTFKTTTKTVYESVAPGRSEQKQWALVGDGAVSLGKRVRKPKRLQDDETE